MTRDFAKKNRPPQRRAKPKSQVPGWVWLFTGAVLGAFVMFLVYLKDLPPTESTTDENKAMARLLEPESETDSETTTPKPRFDFYKLLKESEVIVPATEPERQQLPSGQAQTPADTQEYILQVGSFRNSADADRLRAQLILLNLDARTEQVTLQNEQVWHRVLVGPFTNQSHLASARSTLVSNDYSALVLKRKKEASL